MQKSLRKLSMYIKDQKPDEVLTEYCSLIKTGTDQKVIVLKIIKDMISILYRNKYYHVPHGIMGVVAALDLSSHMSSEKSLPLAQAFYYLANERKLAALDFNVFIPICPQDPFNVFKTYIEDGDIIKAYRVFLGILKLNNGLTKDITSQIAKLAMIDLVNIGHKITYFMKTIELIRYLGQVPDNILFPSISYLASEPKDTSIYKLIENEYKHFLSLNMDVIKNTGKLYKEDTLTTVNILINSMRSQAFEHITKLLQQGISINNISDTITIAASQLILDTDINDWLKPIHGFNYCYALSWWIRNFDDEDKILALYLKAAFVNHLSIDLKKVSFISACVFVKHPNILNNIDKSIKSCNVSDTVCLTQSYLLSKCDITELKNRLLLLAVQNSSIPNFTHDLKFTSSSINEYEQNTSDYKWLILVALAKHLSQSQKDYSCYEKYKKLLLADTKPS